MLPITKVSGPLVTAQITNAQDKPKILETVFVGKNRLLGEIISIQNDECKVQVYEETTGLQVGEMVDLKNELLSVELGPGLLGNIFDGIQRPLAEIDKISPIFIQPGLHLPSLDQTKEWKFEAIVGSNDMVNPGQRLGFVQETENVKHWILAPSNIANNSTILEIKSGTYTLVDVVAKIKNGEEVVIVKLSHKWPVKIARPISSKLSPSKIFKTGQRVIDAMFPILLGAPVSTPGPFGAGKTFTQQQLAKWSNAQIVVYVGCGERGNEMTEMVKLFPELSDPRTGRPLMERTVLIANTSNMPIAAREASIYTGMTIAEYYRDMGYDVVLMADSTSRWAEAMREISARLGEMPADEGYPAYLSSRISEFYERAGAVTTLSMETGSITAVGTVSPAGGDFSDPVTQASLKSTQVFLALDEKLAAKRHYPSINWQTSYSLYEQPFTDILNQTESGSILAKNRIQAKKILNQEDNLLEMVKLVGFDGLNNLDRLTMEIAKSLREDFLQQNGFDPADTYCSFEKLEILMDTIMSMYHKIALAIEADPDNENLVAEIFNARTKYLLSQMKYQTEIDKIKTLQDELFNKINEVSLAQI